MFWLKEAKKTPKHVNKNNPTLTPQRKSLWFSVGLRSCSGLGRASRMKVGRVMVMVVHESMSGQISCAASCFLHLPWWTTCAHTFLHHPRRSSKILGRNKALRFSVNSVWYLISLASWIYLTNRDKDQTVKIYITFLDLPQIHQWTWWHNWYLASWWCQILTELLRRCN